MVNFIAKLGYLSSNGLGAFVQGSPDVFANGRPVVFKLALASNETPGNSSSKCRHNNAHCHPLAQGSSRTVFINGKEAHRVGDSRICSTQHLTVPTPGAINNVLIGD